MSLRTSLNAPRSRRGPPGEPLFTTEEIADRLGITRAELHAAQVCYPGLDPWHEQHKRLYRLSDAKRWWRKIHT